jgi:hypothetical protein
LGFDGYLRSVGDAFSHGLDRPFDDSSHSFLALDHLPEGEGGHIRDQMRLEVVA